MICGGFQEGRNVEWTHDTRWYPSRKPQRDLPPSCVVPHLRYGATAAVRRGGKLSKRSGTRRKMKKVQGRALCRLPGRLQALPTVRVPCCESQVPGLLWNLKQHQALRPPAPGPEPWGDCVCHWQVAQFHGHFHCRPRTQEERGTRRGSGNTTAPSLIPGYS